MTAGYHPNVLSRENIFTPMNSATNALVMKKPPNNINKRVGL